MEKQALMNKRQALTKQSLIHNDVGKLEMLRLGAGFSHIKSVEQEKHLFLCNRVIVHIK